MKVYKKILFLLMVVIPFSCFLQGASSAERRDILRFEPGDTLEQIRAKIKQNGYKFTVDHNWVFDMPAEQKQKFLSRRPPLSPKFPEASEDIGPLAQHIGEKQLPSSFDWRNYNGHIGPIRDQGYCGSCYAFGACAAAEGAYNWANGKYDSNCADFSESYIIWCLGRLPQYKTHFFGCDGADYTYSEVSALTVEGVTNETNFPYTISDPGSCNYWEYPTTVFDSWHRIGCNDIEAIKTAIMTYGVVDAAVYVTSAFVGCKNGIYADTNTSCSSTPCYDTPTNHAIALVGWNDNSDEGYWIFRNSWGATDWGENGYMRIKYTSANAACAVVYLTLGAVPATCPECPSDGVITNATYLAGSTCSCTNATSITLGSNVTVENGATVTFTAPTITVQPGFHTETDAVVNMRQP